MMAAVDAVDILAFGPHPDDIEIGIGATLAKHASLGHRVGLCDLTAGEMGSNGTVEERGAEAEAARAVLGAAWRLNLRIPDRGHRQRSLPRAPRGRDGEAGAPARRRCSVLVGSPPGPCVGQPAPDRRGVQRRAAEVSG
jgi:LmbE family N-acetylglucosaminyl deacetylase